MSKTDGHATNTQSGSGSLADMHDLRLTALMFDLVEARGRVKAAETLGVSYGALARAADTGRLTGRMRDALTRHLLEGADPGETTEASDDLADLERRVAALEKGARGKPEGDDLQTDGLQVSLSKLGEEQDRHSRRIAALETSDRTPPPAPATDVEPATPSRPAYELVVSLHPNPGDDEKRFGAAAPLVVEWRRLRQGYRAAPSGLAKLRAEEDLLEMEMLLIGGCGLSLPHADYPWDRFDLEDQTRRRKRRLAVVRVEIRRAERRRRMRRMFTLGVWRR